jgi:hypothetical protein
VPAGLGVVIGTAGQACKRSCSAGGEKRAEILPNDPTSVVMTGMLVQYSERRVLGASVNEEEVRREELEYATLMVLCPLGITKFNTTPRGGANLLSLPISACLFPNASLLALLGVVLFSDRAGQSS